MSTSSPHPPIPRQPIGATFVVAISVLGAFAVIQFLAVAAHYYPIIKDQVAIRVQPQPAPADSPINLPTPAPAASSNNAGGISGADRAAALKLIKKIDGDYAVGNFDSAMQSVNDLEALIPDDPNMLQRKAAVQEQLGDYAEAVMTYEDLLKNPNLPPSERAKVEKRHDRAAQLAASAPQPKQGSGSPLPPIGPGGGGMRESSIQAGATLGIVSAEIVDGKEGTGTKHLKVAVKARSGASVNVQDVKIVVYFYETTDAGEVTLTDSQVKSLWLSPPIDWANDEPEILDMQYTVPNSETAPGKKYYGYVIGVYYNKELQDFRSDPAKLATDFPLPLYVKDQSN